MSDKPRIYGFCDAGCKWEVMHKDDVKQLVANSAAYIPLEADENGDHIIGQDVLVKVTKASKTSIGATVVVRAKYLSASDWSVTVDLTSQIENAMDEYSKYLRIRLLDVVDAQNEDGTYSHEVRAEIDGERLASRNSSTDFAQPGTFGEMQLVITGASEVMEVNEDASVTLEYECEIDPSRLARAEKEVANLEEIVTHSTDETVAFQKTVPASALPYAEVTEIGGMSYAVDGELKHTPVTTIESVGANILDLTSALNDRLIDNGDGTYTLRYINGSRFSEAFPFPLPKESGNIVNASAEILDRNAEDLQISCRILDPATNAQKSSFSLNEGGSDFSISQGLLQLYLYHSNNSPGDYVTFKNPMITLGYGYKGYTPYSKHTLPIPAEVQALEGWGLGVDETCHNRIVWDPENGVKQYRQEVGIVDMGDLTFSMRVSNERYIFGTSSLRQTIRGFVAGDAPLPAVAVGYRAVKVSDTWVDGDMAYGNATEGYTSIEFVNNAYTDVASFTAAMKGRYLVYALATPIVTDLPTVLDDDNLIKVEGGGTVTAVNADGLAAPSVIEYQAKPDGVTAFAPLTYDRASCISATSGGTVSLTIPTGAKRAVIYGSATQTGDMIINGTGGCVRVSALEMGYATEFYALVELIAQTDGTFRQFCTHVSAPSDGAALAFTAFGSWGQNPSSVLSFSDMGFSGDYGDVSVTFYG